jgi:hypothetical protein
MQFYEIEISFHIETHIFLPFALFIHFFFQQTFITLASPVLATRLEM